MAAKFFWGLKGSSKVLEKHSKAGASGEKETR